MVSNINDSSVYENITIVLVFNKPFDFTEPILDISLILLHNGSHSIFSQESSAEENDQSV